jgi:TonB family protein
MPEAAFACAVRRACAAAGALVLAGAALAGCAHQAPPAPAAPPPAPVAAPAPPPRDDDDGVKVAGTLGTLSDDEIGGPFQRAWDDITRCYEDATARNPYLGGKIELKLRVDKKGDPEKVFVVGSTFGNYGAERCVLAIARGLHFPKPHGGPGAEFTYPIEFRAKRPVLTWDEGRVSPSLRQHKRDVTACKTRAQNGLPPTLMMTVYVGPGGKIQSAGLAADAPLDDEFANCLVQKTRLWRLEDPLGKMAKASFGVAE